MTSPLAISSCATTERVRFGTERQPLLVVDGALADPETVLTIAARHRFGTIGPFYPGVRAAISENIAMDMARPLLNTLRDTFSLERDPQFLECYFSLVATEPAQLAPIQRLPHFDGTEPERLAALLYLDSQERGGTAFFRHRSTGFESVDPGRFDHYRRQLQADAAREGIPTADYIRGDTPLFERVHRVAGLFNRMIVYRGNTLHCADLAADFVPNADPAKGRLTLNLFLA